MNPTSKYPGLNVSIWVDRAPTLEDRRPWGGSIKYNPDGAILEGGLHSADNPPPVPYILGEFDISDYVNGVRGKASCPSMCINMGFLGGGWEADFRGAGALDIGG